MAISQCSLNGWSYIRGTKWLSHMINASKRSRRVWWWRAHKHSVQSGRPNARVKAATTPSLSFLTGLLDGNSLCWPSLLQEGEGITASQLLNDMSQFPGCLINLQSLAAWVKRLNRKEWQTPTCCVCVCVWQQCHVNKSSFTTHALHLSLVRGIGTTAVQVCWWRTEKETKSS